MVLPCVGLEGLFRDFKSGGFQLQNTRLEQADRLDHLPLVTAIAMLWFVAIAQRLIKTGQRRQIDTAKQRARSYFQIGWS